MENTIVGTAIFLELNILKKAKENTKKPAKKIGKNFWKIFLKIKKNKWKINIAAETTGKVNVFGSVEEIHRLVEETSCSFTIDFAHILAREKSVDYEKIKKLFGKYKCWHCHFSGIEYTEKGERKHKKTGKENWKKLLKELPKDKEIVIINESPYDVEDSVEGLSIISQTK